MVWAMCAALKLAAPRVLFTEVIKKQFLQVGCSAHPWVCRSHGDARLHGPVPCIAQGRLVKAASISLLYISFKSSGHRPSLYFSESTCPRRRW